MNTGFKLDRAVNPKKFSGKDHNKRKCPLFLYQISMLLLNWKRFP
jgi:hypothetical protein